MTTTPPTTTRDPAAQASRARTIEANQAAWDYWRWHANQAAAWTTPYLTSRGLPDLEHGYAPAGWTRLTPTLRKRGFTDHELLTAGLTRRTTSGTLIDVFRDRLMLPIRDEHDAIIGFTARRNPALDADPEARAPKYLNTATTAAFDKSRTWYGLDRAAATRLASGEGTVVVVEGALDAEAVRTQAGPWVPVAACGTAITPRHLHALASINPNALRHAVLALDPDTAGQAATRRLWDQLTPDVAALIRCAALPNDPAQMLQGQHGSDLRHALTNSPRYVETLVDEHLAALAPTFQEQHLQLARLADIVARLDPYTLGELTDRLASGYRAIPTADLTLPDVVAAFVNAHEHVGRAARTWTSMARGGDSRGVGPPTPPTARAGTPHRRAATGVER